MKLKHKATQQPTMGLPRSHREWWNISDGYEVFIDITGAHCALTIDSPESNDMTLEIAKYLGIFTKLEDITAGPKKDGGELYLSYGIDCIILNYTKPENYKELLEKLETIVNVHFKRK